MTNWQPGDTVLCNGHKGTVRDCYMAPQQQGFSGMYNVRMLRGEVCVPGASLIPWASREVNYVSALRYHFEGQVPTSEALKAVVAKKGPQFAISEPQALFLAECCITHTITVKEA